jgi:hypothetical protein
MTRTRVLAALLAGLTLAGLGTAATALGSDDPTPRPVTVGAQTPAATSRATTPVPAADAVTRVTDDHHRGRHGSDDGAGHDRFDDRFDDHGGDR